MPANPRQPRSLPGFTQEQSEALFRELARRDAALAAARTRDASAVIQTDDFTARANQTIRVQPPDGGQVGLLPPPELTVAGDRVTIIIEAPFGTLTLACAPNESSGGEVSAATINGSERVTFTVAGTVEFVSNGSDNWTTASEHPAETAAVSATAIASNNGEPYVTHAPPSAALTDHRQAKTSDEIEVQTTTSKVIRWAIVTASIALSKLADITGPTVLGRTSGTGVPQELTPSELGSIVRTPTVVTYSGGGSAVVLGDTGSGLTEVAGLDTADELFVGADCSIAGIAAPANSGKRLTIRAASGVTVSLLHINPAAASANRIATHVPGTYSFENFSSIELVYRSTGIGTYWHVTPGPEKEFTRQHVQTVTTTGNIDDLVVNDGVDTLRFTGAAPVLRSITSKDASGGTDGRMLTLEAYGTTLSIPNNAGTGTAGDKFLTPGLATITIPPYCSALVCHKQSGIVRWHFESDVTPDSLRVTADNEMLVNISGAVGIPSGRALNLMIDNSTLEYDAASHFWQVKDAGVTAAKLASDVTWSAVLANGATSGAVNPQVDNGQSLLFDGAGDADYTGLSGDVLGNAGLLLVGDHALGPSSVDIGATSTWVEITSPFFVVATAGGYSLFDPGFLMLTEQSASTPTLAAGRGMFWTRDDAPNVPMFTDDGNTDHELQYGGRPTLTGSHTTQQDDYARANDEIVLRLTPTSSFDLTGIAAGREGDVVFVRKEGASNSITIKDESTGSTTSNRIRTPTGDLVLSASGEMAGMVRSSSRWRVFTHQKGRLLATTTYTTGSGTHTYQDATRLVHIIQVGGGGGGGGADGQGASTFAHGGGGGAGAYDEDWVSPGGATSSYSVGAGGSGGSGASPNDGTAGGSSSTSELGSTGGGGAGQGVSGVASSSSQSSGGASGGTSAGATIFSDGSAGASGWVHTGFGSTGKGGDGPWGGGGGASFVIAGEGSGVAGAGPGAGGSGAYAIGTTNNRTGGAGSDGIVIYEEYS